jgi:D-xylose transport system permease protein
MTEKIEINRFKIETSALRAYTLLGALILIWVFFHYATAQGCPAWWDAAGHLRFFFSFGWLSGGIFLTPRNLSNLMLQTSVTGILAVGMLMLIVAGQIDLSVGSVLGLAGGAAAIFLTNLGYGLVPSIVSAVVVGILIGLFHGVLVAYGKIPAFIVTLGGLLAWRGAIKAISQSETIPISDANFKAIGQQYIPSQIGWAIALIAVAGVLFLAIRRIQAQKKFTAENTNPTAALVSAIVQIILILSFIYIMNSYAGVPVPVLIFLTVALIGVFITNFTVFGRYLYAIGGNPDAARLSGINNEAKIVQVYVLLGALTGIAALIFTARVGSASPDAGTLKELDAIAACVIGGASLIGGRGTIYGACLGALIMASLDNGMSLLNVKDFMQDIIKGSILVAAVGLDMIGRKQN